MKLSLKIKKSFYEIKVFIAYASSYGSEETAVSTKSLLLEHKKFLWFGLVLYAQSTAMVMSRLSVHQTTPFP